jgi:hypothetical protein
METAVTVCALILFSLSSAWAQRGKVPAECLARNPSLTEAACEARLRDGAPVMADCADLSGEAYRKCAAALPSDEKLEILEQRRELARQQQTEQLAEQERLKGPAGHAQVVATLKAAGIDLPPDAVRLPTGHEAAQALADQMRAVGKEASAEELMKASHGAEAAEVKAMQLGLGWVVDDNERATILAKQKEEQESAQRRELCPKGVQIGMTRDQVYDCLGYPDETNSDVSTDQLVYPGGTYVYIDRNTGRVENVQWTH